MKLSETIIAFDGGFVDEETIRLFSLDKLINRNSKDKVIPAIRQDNYGSYKLNFVGYVFSAKKTLAVFPKKYSKLNKVSELSQDDLSILSSVLLKYNSSYLSNNRTTDRYFEASYPFAAYYGILHYYKTYGIYKDFLSTTKPGSGGKVNWKKTISKANQFFSNGNLIFSQLYTDKSISEETFISDCMKFALDYTSNKYSFILTERIYFSEIKQFDFISNKEYIINELKILKSRIFKDIHKKLLDDLISFFQDLRQDGVGYFRNYKFDKVWEAMVEEYLNANFSDISEDNGLIFEENCYKYKFSKQLIEPGTSHKGLVKLYPDHYYFSKEKQFVFDSKYYSSLKGLDYKQITYFEFLKSRARRTYNALIFPDSEERWNNLHFELFEEFKNKQDQSERLIIWNSYLNMKEVMEFYINKKNNQ
ncbi:TPA: LlaJI family restriction endonuclease [Streptococcus suis]